MAATKARLLGLAALILLAAILSVWRISEFAQIEPRQDQAAFQQWVRALAEAKHWLPEREPGQAWRAALEADAHSVLHVVLQQIYVAPILMLTMLSVVAFALGAMGFGVSF